MVGLAILVAFAAIAIVGPFIWPFDFRDIPRPDKIVRSAGRPSLAHPFGETGGLQRDVLTLVVNGARTSLFIGFGSMLLGVLIGTIVGAISGFIGGFTDNLLMRIVDVMLSLPLLFVILVVANFLGGGKGSPLLIVVDLRAVQLDGREPAGPEPVPVDSRTRVRRGGASRRRARPADHLPAHPAERPEPDRRRRVADRRRGNIIAEAFISFLGFGVDPTSRRGATSSPTPGRSSRQGNWWWPFFSGAAIIVTVLAVNFVGDGLRDAFDPRSRA